MDPVGKNLDDGERVVDVIKVGSDPIHEVILHHFPQVIFPVPRREYDIPCAMSWGAERYLCISIKRSTGMIYSNFFLGEGEIILFKERGVGELP